MPVPREMTSPRGSRRQKILGQRDNRCLTQVNRAPACAAMARDPMHPAMRPRKRLISIKPVLPRRRRFFCWSTAIVA
jgi:hypothetical protein